MRRTLTEESILFASVIKWIALASCTGVVVGLAATAFLKSLSWATDAADGWSHTYLFLPLAFLVSSLLTTYLAPDAAGHGTEKVIEAIHRRASVIPLGVRSVKLLATVLTALDRWSAQGRPLCPIGAGLSSLSRKNFAIRQTDRKKLVICGISAGVCHGFRNTDRRAFSVSSALCRRRSLRGSPAVVHTAVTAYQVSSALGIPTS
jgi:H+/Cl- antiporter ClcA